MCAWTWGRELFLAFWKPDWPALSPTQLNSSTKASGSFSESLFLVIGPRKPQLMTETPTKGTSSLQWPQLTHTKLLWSWLIQHCQPYQEADGTWGRVRTLPDTTGTWQQDQGALSTAWAQRLQELRHLHQGSQRVPAISEHATPHKEPF